MPIFKTVLINISEMTKKNSHGNLSIALDLIRVRECLVSMALKSETKHQHEIISLIDISNTHENKFYAKIIISPKPSS